MKKAILFVVLCLGGFTLKFCSEADKPKAAGVPGDNLDLYAVLNLFKKSASPQDFEKSLNSKSTGINNLDLNNDGKVDYICVVDKTSGDDHALTLRVPVSKTETQDVAVIEIEKTKDKTANIQIIGDEDVYGKNMVIEPQDEDAHAGFVYASAAVSLNVWEWPCVMFIFSPAYVVWESPWYWDYYPTWWAEWEPVEYDVYYPAVYAYHDYYVNVEEPRFPLAQQLYMSDRRTSPLVRENFRKNERAMMKAAKNENGGERIQEPVSPGKRNMDHMDNTALKAPEHHDNTSNRPQEVKYGLPGKNPFGNEGMKNVPMKEKFQRENSVSPRPMTPRQNSFTPPMRPGNTVMPARSVSPRQNGRGK